MFSERLEKWKRKKEIFVTHINELSTAFLSPASLSIWKVFKWYIILFSKLNCFFQAVEFRNLAILTSCGHLQNYKKFQRFKKIHFLATKIIYFSDFEPSEFYIRLYKCFQAFHVGRRLYGIDSRLWIPRLFRDYKSYIGGD